VAQALTEFTISHDRPAEAAQNRSRLQYFASGRPRQGFTLVCLLRAALIVTENFENFLVETGVQAR
jgi:hypothetical protein